ncbi:hypothetical protein T492DRAFT_974801 [Pavlovales sp. CCMP2436]|nr:hypothetical protein T492DRAFT_974801 [Pavlovales sp. CCMP2436]
MAASSLMLLLALSPGAAGLASAPARALSAGATGRASAPARALRHPRQAARMDSGAACALLTLGATTDRGQRASAAERALAGKLLAELERAPQVSEPAALAGEWELVYATEAPYRASPFFAAFRKLADGQTAAVRPFGSNSDSLAEAIFRITDTLPFKEVGVVRQTINATHLVSRVVLAISIFDALLPRSSSVMESSAALLPPDEADAPQRTRLRVERTQVLDSSIGALFPFLSLDQVRFPTSELFEQLKPGSSLIEMETTFVGSEMRVSRYEPGQAFVWTRVAQDAGAQ